MSNKPTFCAIIPDRGDRPKLTEFCFRQLERMTVNPDKVYHINHKPKNDGVDLIERVHEGLNNAIKDGIQWCFIIEDDYYPFDYFYQYYTLMMDPNKIIIGDRSTVYYNLRNRTYAKFDHPNRSSLFTTAFRSSIPFSSIVGNNLSDPFLDIKLWRYFSHSEKGFVNSGAFGVKHGIGKCAGRGHSMIMAYKDLNLKQLEGKLYHSIKNDVEAWDFYRSLSEELYKS